MNRVRSGDASTCADPSWRFGDFPRRCIWLQKFTITRLVASISCYQPVSLAGRELAPGDRQCLQRWTLIRPVLTRLDTHSVLDLGCAEGFFVRQAAQECGCFAVGMDADIRRITIASEVALQDKISGAAFMQGSVSIENIEKFPKFDMVIFLSVLHHIIVSRGIEYGRKILGAIKAKTGKALIFDMGQSDESDHAWSNVIPRMEPDAGQWIAALLRESGFSEIVELGETDSYLGVARRRLFVAFP